MLKRIKEEMHLYEKKVLKALESEGGESTPEKVLKLQLLPIKSVMSAAGILASKDIIKVNKDVREFVELTDYSKEIAENKTPFSDAGLQEFVYTDGTYNPELNEYSISVSATPAEFKPSIGWLRKKGIANIENGQLKIPKQEIKWDEVELIDLIHSKNGIFADEIPDEYLEAFQNLKKRKDYLIIDKKSSYDFQITPLGKEILEEGIEIREEATQITHEQLKSGSWRNLHYRAYDIKAEHPESFAGKLHPLQRTIEEIRRIFLNLGFTESRGTILESAFWNFDCLFQPQDHAAREMQDTFYIKTPRETMLPDEELVEKVKRAHEHGGKTGSKGWKYQWDREVARQSVLRTHTTCVSARFLKETQPPLKMFSVGRVFRRETITYKHLPEFHQVEGIVADKSITFRNLLGILKESYHQLGFQVRFRPAYFPYTYLSTECEIYLPEKESWIELGGAGMFRPEVLEPLGVETPVAAFGLGIERLAMIRLGIKDIRMLYQSDIGWLRELPVTHSVEWDEI
jgi:phenylalanyl-tRNA synthetase alpha chain